MGFDTVFLRRDTAPELLEEARKGFVVLTRRVRLDGRPNVYVIVHDRVEDQLSQLAALVDLGCWIDPFSRCSLCNTPLKPCSPLEVRELVPEYVFMTQESFARCEGCGRVYWKGTHHERMYDRIRNVIRDRGS